MRSGIKYILVPFYLMICSCKHSLPVDGYMQFVQDKKNELKKTVHTGEWEFTIQYKPTDYMLIQEFRGKTNVIEMNKRRADLHGTAWFNICIQRADGKQSPIRYGITSLDEYNLRLDYFLNRAKDDIKLLYGSDTLHPSSYLFENNYNLTPQETIVVGFNLPGNDPFPIKDMQISYCDRIYKNGIIKTTYRSEILKQIPTVIN